MACQLSLNKGLPPDQREKRLKYLEYWHSNGGVMLLNYDQFRHMLLTSPNKEEFSKLLINPGPDVVVLDEGHIIRNAASQTSQLVSNFRTRARICLTGYPLQNHILEYYHMLDFIAPGMLGSPEVFKSYFTFYIEKSYADSSGDLKKNALKRFYILQLLTDEVTHRRDLEILEKELPPKTEYVVKFKMTDIQLQGYQQALKTMESYGSLLDNLFVLRTICNHPKIFQKLLIKRKSKRREKFYVKEASHLSSTIQNHENFNNADSQNNRERADINSEETIFEIEEAEIPDWDDNAYSWTLDYFKDTEIESWKSSNKISFIVDLAANCKIVGEKIIIVSHSLASHDYLQHLFSIIDIKSSRVDGNTFSNERQTIIDDFNSDNNKLVLLLSAKAAAIGVNVTGASRIVLMDQDWNPLYDEQSIGRIYRYGQSKPVIVYRLITCSTIEERIYTQSLHKRSISRRLIDNKISSVISKEDLKSYYVRPDVYLPLVDIDEIRNNICPDYVTYEVLLQNKNYITDFDFYKIEPLDVHIPTAQLTKKERKIAAMDALTFLKKWRHNKGSYKQKKKEKRA
ncbi:P-loop containing nucleoside triphosphate hydrolase protein [Sporodiniella umbellata]|nr:P-loop containing nucleoside triphosphate hydrolase protein [Sporodiniella umbellata]